MSAYLTISYHGFKLGVAFYRLGFDKIELLHEVYEYYDFCYTRKILRQMGPSDVVISSSCDTQLVNFLKNSALSTTESKQSSVIGNVTKSDKSVDSDVSVYAAYDHNQSNSRISKRYKLHILSNRLFQFEKCKTRILSMNLPQMAKMVDRTERFVYLTANIDFSEIHTIKSLGVLLNFLEKNPSFTELTTHTTGGISGFVYFSCNYLTMDQATFEALEIFQHEWHPSTLKKGFYKREGFSLFGIFDTCSSKLGSFHLKKLFQQPTTDFQILVQRQDVIEFFVNPTNQIIKDAFIEKLKHIKDISPILNRFKMFDFRFCDFEVVLCIISNMISIRNTIAKFENVKVELFSQITKVMTNELEEICKHLQSTIDYNSSNNDNIEIHPNIDKKLDQLKMLFNELPTVLNQVLMDESEEKNLRALYLCNLTNLYVPQLGFLIAIPLVEVQKISNLEDYDLETVFCANDRSFLKNKKMREFDRYYGDIMFTIVDRKRQVLVGCRELINQHKKTLKASISLCAQLDAMIAMAQAAIKYKYTRPIVMAYGETRIEEGRHPLYELLNQPFVPNCFSSDDDERKIVFIFGDNGCGKTVYLKQVCLIVYLAHIGSYVPAKRAEIRIIDKLFTRIKTPESLSTQLSSFKHDLNQIIMSIKYATRRSLVVVDTFGKGTHFTDGFALLSACIKHWAKSHNRPQIVISSQFDLHSTFSQLSEISFYMFDKFGLILQHESDENADDADNTIIPSFQIPRIEAQEVKESQGISSKQTRKHQAFIQLANSVLDKEFSGELCQHASQMIKLALKQ